MVTQDLVAVSKMKKMKKKNKKKLKKKQKKGLEGLSTDSEGESVDLSEKLYPLSHYVSDQEELVNQMFATIQGAKLEAMLPPVLKSVPLKELKKLCLHELRGMSKKRILASIGGQVMEGSSGSEDEEEEEMEEQTEKGNNPDEKAVVGKRKSGAEEEIPESYLLKKIKVEPGTEDNSSGAGKSTDTGKSVLELLELEMRARIIKTMLEKGQDGSKISEDAIAAVMQSAKQITGEDPMQTKGLVSIDKIDGSENNDKEMDNNNEKERLRSSRKKHRRRYASKDNVRRRRERDRSQEDHEFSHRSKRESKSKERKSKSDTLTIQRKKITRKEFQERMKRAKKNRTYRQRKTSEDEEKEKENEGEDDQQKNDTDIQSERNSEARKKITGVGETGPDGKSQEEKEEGVNVDGSEKEEGEIDSNEEEEEGACSPSDVSSYSSCCSYTRSYSSSRSRSRSYTRSPSPYRKRSRSRGRRSYSHSRSRSPVYRRRHRKTNYPQSRSADNWTKNEKCKSYSKKDEKPGILKDISSSKEAIKPSQQAEPREEEENWGQKCDIEFVDSDEDFDDNPDESKQLQPGAVSQASERASISFSLQKKSAPSITPGVDLDDLPRKKSQGKECTTELDVGVIAMVEQPKKASEEIVISSDSEGETSKNNCSALPSESKQKDCLPNNQPDHTSISDKTEQQSGMISDIDGKKTQPVLVSPQVSGTSISRATEAQSEKERRYDNTIQSETAEKVVPGSGKSEPKLQSTSGSDLTRNMSQTCVTSESVLSNNKPAVLAGNESNYMTELSVSKEDVQSKALDYADKVIENEPLSTADSVQEYGHHESHGISQKAEELYVPGSASKSHVNFDVKESQGGKLEPKVLEIEGSSCENLDLETSEGKGDPYEKFDIKISESNADQVDKLKVKKTENKSQSEKLEAKIPESKGIHNENLRTKTSEIVKEPGYADRQISNRERNVDFEDSDTCNTDNRNKLNEVQSAPINVSVMNTEATKLEAESIIEEDKSHTNEKMLSTSLQIGTCTEITASNDLDIENIAGGKNLQCPNDKNNETQVIVENVQQETNSTHTHENRKSGCTLSNEDNTVTETREDFYRGADQLEFSDDDETSYDHEELMRDDTPVEPIRIETGLISKPVMRREKIKNVAPEVSWTKKEKKKREKTKGQLAMEGIGLIKSTLAEKSTTPSTEIDDTQSTISDTDKSHCRTPQTHEEAHLVDINYETKDPKSDEGFKQSDQETEIIGVIETSNDTGQNPVDEMDLGGASWSMRWLQSEKVQKVVSSSKMLSRVRKKIQRKGKQAKIVVEKIEETQQPPQPQVSVIGSIEEYERLFGMKVKTSTEVTTVTTSSTHEAVATTSSVKAETEDKAAPIFGSEDEGEDSEEEALWSKILKK